MIERKTLPLQIHTGKRPRKEKFEPPLNYGGEHGRRSGFMKPAGGLWTSTLDTALEIGWPSWCLSERFRVESLERAWLLEPVECRVIELAGFDMCHEFMLKYGKELVQDARADRPIYEGTYATALAVWTWPSMVCPQWEEIAEEVDAVRLLTPFDFDVRLGPYLAFNGWDCESTIWLRWCFKGPAKRIDLQPAIAAYLEANPSLA